MFIGIDTSNYTTSVSLVKDGVILKDKRTLLKVKEGMRGLRQSEAFYQHVNNLPELLKEVSPLYEVRAICVSDAPRRVEGSYMPCFTAGVNIAEILSNALSIPLYKVSHQQGHIRAALYNNDVCDEKPFLCVHLSGGTTEVLAVNKINCNYTSEIVGATSDISAGQFIDRIGVKCGLSFPCGAKMDSLCKGLSPIKLPTSVKECAVSFSGVETKLEKIIETNEYSNEEIFTSAFECVANSLSKLISECCKKTNINTVLLAGGVSGSENIKRMLNSKLTPKYNINYAPSGYGSDNAVGVALLCEEMYRRDNNE